MKLFILGLVLATACGAQRKQDAEDSASDPNKPSSLGDGSFVIATGSKSNDAVPVTCGPDLMGQDVLDPSSGAKETIFKGRMALGCQVGGKKMVLYISSPAKFSMPTDFGCNISNVTGFNFRCQGPAVASLEQGYLKSEAGKDNIQVKIMGDAGFDSSKLKIRVTYE